MIRIFVLVSIVLSGALSAESLSSRAQRGLKALVGLQQEDGSFGRSAGIDALAGIALLAGGHTPQRGTYREASRKCLESILTRQDSVTGYLGDQHSTMYGHGFATLYLAECYGESSDPRLLPGLHAALDLIFRAQNNEGGWRYDPQPNNADISVTVCQINAIRAAYNSGIGGDRATVAINKALGYVQRCYNGNGTFRYRADTPRRTGPIGTHQVPRMAAGLMSLMGAGIYTNSNTMLQRSLEELRNFVGIHMEEQGAQHYWYGQYYAAQAMFLSPDPNDWNRYIASVNKHIAPQQRENGLWTGPSMQGVAYNTAMALIIIQVDNNYLPIFQR